MPVSPAKKQFSHGNEGRKGSVKLAGKTVTYTVRLSERARNLRLRVGVETGLEVIAPKKFNLGNLEDILREKQAWILDKMNYFARLAKNRRLFRQQAGRRVLYRGLEYEVETKVANGVAGNVALEEGKLIVTVPEGAEGEAGAVLEKWFRYMARLLVNERIRAVNEELKLSFNRVFIKDQKTRWGSCSQQKNLNFNWRLIMAPQVVLDYIIVHELMHLVEPNHSRRFWALVEEICPGYKIHRVWLKENGRRLTGWPDCGKESK